MEYLAICLAFMLKSIIMNGRTRQQQMLRYLEEHDYLSVEEATRLYEASPATIRRDFTTLAQNRLAERTRGGMNRVQPAAGEALPFGLRQVQYTAEKAALARHAVKLLEPDDVIIVDGGTSTFHLVRYLPDFPLRIITNSLRLAAGLDEERFGKSAWEVLLVGGNLYPGSGLLIGPQASANLAQYHARWAFLSAEGVCEDGVYNTNEFVAECERIMVRNAEQVVLLADPGKIGQKAMCHVCGFDQIDYLITVEQQGTAPMLATIEQQGVNIQLAPIEQL